MKTLKVLRIVFIPSFSRFNFKGIDISKLDFKSLDDNIHARISIVNLSVDLSS